MPHDLLGPYFCGLGPWGLGCVTRDESTNLSELWRPRFRKAENAGCCEDAMAVVTGTPAWARARSGVGPPVLRLLMASSGRAGGGEPEGPG